MMFPAVLDGWPHFCSQQRFQQGRFSPLEWATFTGWAKKCHGTSGRWPASLTVRWSIGSFAWDGILTTLVITVITHLRRLNPVKSHEMSLSLKPMDVMDDLMLDPILKRHSPTTTMHTATHTPALAAIAPTCLGQAFPRRSHHVLAAWSDWTTFSMGHPQSPWLRMDQ